MVVSVACVLVYSAVAQDPVAVAPDKYKALQENERVRVLEVRLQPGDKLAMHSHPDYVSCSLSGGKVRFTAPDGKTTDVELKPGETQFRAAETHAVENIGTGELRVLNIELKAAAPVVAAQNHIHEHIALAPTELEWKAGPAALPAGARAAVLSGDPQKPGPFAIRFRAPDGYRIPPHWHPADENVTVISGTFHLGAGDTFDESKGKEFPAGGFTAMPAGMHHFAWVTGETEIQIHGIGPWDIKYLNPADDPRLKLTPTGRTEE
jgi:quercetin dioxygenase-like cupin family protein